MHKKQLTEKLYENHSAFIEYINSLTDHEFVYDQSAKWTAGQQISHIILSVRPLVQIFRLPHFILKIILKRSNRPGRSFDELVNKYLSKLQNGGRATGRFVPESIEKSQKEQLIKQLAAAIEKLTSQINTFSETDLDTLIIPHPLLGKLTIREMMYFTIYHVKHHHQIAKRNLETVA